MKLLYSILLIFFLSNCTTMPLSRDTSCDRLRHEAQYRLDNTRAIDWGIMKTEIGDYWVIRNDHRGALFDQIDSLVTLINCYEDLTPRQTFDYPIGDMP